MLAALPGSSLDPNGRMATQDPWVDEITDEVAKEEVAEEVLVTQRSRRARRRVATASGVSRFGDAADRRPYPLVTTN